ncbi:MAG: hypothetical protein JWL59_1393 [Chthoniobacteraceae bacterium]|nr:hypothetical protein [Chthoniobacteraceae bacterium]
MSKHLERILQTSRMIASGVVSLICRVGVQVPSPKQKPGVPVVRSRALFEKDRVEGQTLAATRNLPMRYSPGPVLF